MEANDLCDYIDSEENVK
ncbi:hypothetical protein NE171_14095 [Clostridium botulinum]|nr:hypothetical protein [Clostridium botulinum]